MQAIEISASKESVKDVQKDIILAAITYVERNLEEPIQIEDVALAFEKSHWYFQRLFRSVIGVSLGHYLRLRRLSEAAWLLRNSDQRIIDIAIRFDFGSQEAFTRAFKKFGGINPNEYRENSNYVIREILNAVTAEKLNYFWSGVQRVPTIVQLPEKFLFGSRADFLSHFEEGSDCKVKIVEHWLKFLGLKKSVADQVGKEIYGVALSDEKDLREKKLSYLASVETTNLNQKVLDFGVLTRTNRNLRDF